MHLVLVDGSTFIFRAFHALPQLTRKSDGLPVGCVAGFCNMIFKLTEDLKGDDAPTHMAVIFDYSSATFRDAIYTEYKTHRPPTPPELVPQFPLTRAATKAYGLPSIEMEGWEADDIIATYARLAREAGGKVTIVSSDKDMMQLVEPDGSIRMLDTIPRPGQPPLRWIGMDEVFTKFGVTPDKVIEVQALCGDAVDNVPGVPGIGVKTAAELINTYGDIETLLARTSEIKQPKRREALEQNAELARISKLLVTLSQHVPVELPLDALVRTPIEAKTLFPFLKAMEFTTVTKRLAVLLDADPDAFAADPALAAAPAVPVGFDNTARAEDGTATRTELSGSTITITSLGALGGLVTTPIINHPEVAIVGINKLQTRPMWDGNSFLPRSMMNLSSSFDHRIIDGWVAATFVQRIRTLLEEPSLLFTPQPPAPHPPSPAVNE